MIVPGSADQSRLFKLVSHLEEPNMPPMRAKLADDKLDIIRRWINEGALAEAPRKSASTAPAPHAADPGTPTPHPPAPARDPDAPPMPLGATKLPVEHTPQPPPACALAISPAAPLLAVANGDQVLFFNTETRDFLAAYSPSAGDIERLRFTHDGTVLLAASGLAGKLGQAATLDVETGEVKGTYDRLYDAPRAADISPDGLLVAVGGSNRKVRVFDANTRDVLYEVKEHNEWVEAVAFSPDGLYLATADRAGAIFVWESDTGRKVSELRGHTGIVHALAWLPDSATLASVGQDGALRLWRAEDGASIKQIGAHHGDALDVAVAPDGRIATCGADSHVRLFKPDGAGTGNVDVKSDWVYSVAFGPEGKTVFAGDWNGVVHIVDAASGQQVATLATQPPEPSSPPVLQKQTN